MTSLLLFAWFMLFRPQIIMADGAWEWIKGRKSWNFSIPPKGTGEISSPSFSMPVKWKRRLAAFPPEADPPRADGQTTRQKKREDAASTLAEPVVPMRKKMEGRLLLDRHERVARKERTRMSALP